MRSNNPVLSTDKYRSGDVVSSDGIMTVSGTIMKTGIMLLTCFAAAMITWANPQSSAMVFGGAIAGFVLAIIISFNPPLAKNLALPYAIAEGLFLGAFSIIMEKSYPGIVVQGVIATFGTMLTLLVLYRTGLIRVSEKFKGVVMTAVFSIGVVYVIHFIMSIFGSGMHIVQSSSPFGIIFSAFVVIVASLCLLLDFDYIEQGAQMQAPKYMEWYSAFGLMVTLVWLYIEFVRLISKLRD